MTICTITLLLASWMVQDSFRPETWFHLLGGNVSRAGLTADLEAIKAGGLSGVQLFHGKAPDWPGTTNSIPCLSQEWEEMIGFAGDECRRLGLSLKLQNCPGWSMSGGPWIAPSNAIRELVAMRVDYVSDGKNALPELPRFASPDNFYEITDAQRDWRDLRVFAFPTPVGDSAAPLEPVAATTNGNDYVFTFAQPVCIRTVTFPPQQMVDHSHCQDLDAAVTLRGDGKVALAGRFASGVWQDWAPYSMACDSAVTAKTWRLSVTCPRQLKFPYIRFLDGVRLDNFETKAGFCLRGREHPHRTMAAPDAILRKGDILDVTGRTAPLPAGRWTLLRVGHRWNGMMNGPAPVEARGPECDKMERSGFACIFSNYTGRLLSRALAGGKLKGLLVDSWECGSQTWTARMPEHFREFAGYDVWPMMPALFGYVIDSVEATESFLRDWRRNQSRLVEDNYYGEIARQAKARGLSVQWETAFGDVISGDILRFWKYADEPMCEFWQPHTPGLFVGDHDFKPTIPCASAAHLYGKRRVSAEALTSFRLDWNENFRTFKSVADIHFARGITHLVFHTCTHNPFVDGLPPGSSFGGIGSPFVRKQTWWRHLPFLTAYFARCGEALEKGLPVIDGLRYLGDDVDKHPSEKILPCGNRNKIDYLNNDVLMTRLGVKDGRFVLPDGMSYAFLFVPDGLYLAPETQRKLAELAQAGGKVVRSLEKTPCAGDVTVGDGTDETPVHWYHRSEPGRDWYFVAAPSNGFCGRLVFRAATPHGELYDPVDGSVRTYDGWLDLAPHQSVFVVFSAKGSASRRSAADTAEGGRIALAKWTVEFPGRPAQALERLLPWKDLPGTAEERAFSGDAVYRTTFKADGRRHMRLDLGRVEAWATVRVNGRTVATLWCEPYACDIDEALKDGENELEVTVTSTWRNRLIFDAGQPPERRRTWTDGWPNPAAPLVPSGLLGPVFLNLR